MIEYFYGEDSYRARQAIASRAKQAQATIRWLGREELTARPLPEWTGQRQSLFGTELIVVLDPGQMPRALQASLVDALKQQQEAAAIVWERGMPDKRSALFRQCRARAQEFMYQSEAQVAAWLTQEARARGSVLEPAAATALVHHVGKDGWRLLGELEKLSLQCDRITAAHVAEETVAATPSDIFTVLDALMLGDRRRVLQHVEQLLQEGHSELYILSMLGYQFRTLLILERYHGQSPAHVAAATQLHPFVVEKGLRQLRHLSVAWLLDTLTRVLATDFAIKQGKVDAKTALVLLLWHIADHVRGPAARRAVRSA